MGQQVARAENPGARGGEAAEEEKEEEERLQAGGPSQGVGGVLCAPGPTSFPQLLQAAREQAMGAVARPAGRARPLPTDVSATSACPLGPLLGTVASAPCTPRRKSQSWGAGFTCGLSQPGWPAERPPTLQPPEDPWEPREGQGAWGVHPTQDGNQGEERQNKDIKSRGRDQGDVSGPSSRKVTGLGRGQAWLCQRMARGGDPLPSTLPLPVATMRRGGPERHLERHGRVWRLPQGQWRK